MSTQISAAQAAQQSNRTADGRFNFGTHAEANGLALSSRPQESDLQRATRIFNESTLAQAETKRRLAFEQERGALAEVAMLPDVIRTEFPQAKTVVISPHPHGFDAVHVLNDQGVRVPGQWHQGSPTDAFIEVLAAVDRLRTEPISGRQPVWISQVTKPYEPEAGERLSIDLDEAPIRALAALDLITVANHGYGEPAIPDEFNFNSSRTSRRAPGHNQA